MVPPPALKADVGCHGSMVLWSMVPTSMVPTSIHTFKNKQMLMSGMVDWTCSNFDDVDVKDGFLLWRLLQITEVGVSTMVWLLTAAPCHCLKLSCQRVNMSVDTIDYFYQDIAMVGWGCLQRELIVGDNFCLSSRSMNVTRTMGV